LSEEITKYPDWVAEEWNKIEPVVVTMLGSALASLIVYKLFQASVMAYDAWKKKDLTEMIRSLAFSL